LNLRFIFFAFFLITHCLLYAQSSKKKNKNPGLIGKAYHDITARNNAFFNGNEKMKAVLRCIRENHKDDFTQILPVYIDRNPESAKGAGSEMDAIVKKASKIITKHEPSKWADNAYMILGKSYFYKGDYDNSVKSFQYVLTNYKIKKKKGSSNSSGKSKSSKSSNNSSSKSNSSSKKPMTAAQLKAAQLEEEKEEEQKKEEKQIDTQTEEEKTGFNATKYFKESFTQKLRHKPSYYEAFIWLADNYTYMGKYDEAMAVFTVLDSRRGKFPFRLSDELELSRTNLYLFKKDYSKAMESLKLVTAMIKKSKKNNRYHYIMAQLFEQDKNYTEAVNNYKLSMKGRPRYEMLFAAQMSIARIASYDQSMSPVEIKKMLTKLAKDEKNKEFLDQVYYYLAELCLRENDNPCAKENLNKSVELSVNNNRQKAISHLKLADLYFNEEKYREAQVNYAAAVALIDDKFPGYSDYKFRSEILADLVKQLDIIYEQDSLLRIASLPEKERNKFIDDLIFEKEQKAKADKEKSEQLASNPANKSKPQLPDDSGGSKSDWYFYNTTLKANGYNEFIKIWGAKRKPEDNWRRSNKSASVFDDIASVSDTSSTSVSSASLDRAELLKNFPITKEAKEKADDILITALYEAATIYKGKLNNNNKAIESFEELLIRYPKNKYESQVYYNLYLLLKETGNISKSDYYKELLLNKFPDSQFAKIILDPNYLSRQGKKNKEIEDYYETTYSYYKQGVYDSVILLASNASTLFKENNLKPKFALLNAYAIGKTKDLKTYKEALNDIIENYPGNEVKMKAEEILNFLENSDSKEIKIQNNISDFDYNPDDGHYFMITYTSDTVKSSEISNVIAKYNDINRSLEDLKINTLILKDNITMVAVKSFRNLPMANDYLGAIVSANVLSKYAPGILTYSIISENNFNLIIKHREIESYLLFYQSRYSR
jgi:tetratricopeptide (TPR) repeat protein